MMIFRVPRSERFCIFMRFAENISRGKLLGSNIKNIFQNTSIMYHWKGKSKVLDSKTSGKLVLGLACTDNVSDFFVI